MKAIRILLLTTCGFGICLAAQAQEAVVGSGGTLTAPTTVGHNITVTGIQLTDGKTAILSCPVTFFGASIYEWRWSCAKGTLSLNGARTATVQGSVTLTCSGGGRAHGTTCWHIFTGTATDSDAGAGAVMVVAKGGANNRPGVVKMFSATW